MVRTMKCPRCSGLMITQPASWMAPRHDSCLNCGDYVEHLPETVMPMFPLPENPLLSSKHRPARSKKMTPLELREQNRLAQARFYAALPKEGRKRGPKEHATPCPY